MARGRRQGSVDRHAQTLRDVPSPSAVFQRQHIGERNGALPSIPRPGRLEAVRIICLDSVPVGGPLLMIRMLAAGTGGAGLVHVVGRAAFERADGAECCCGDASEDRREVAVQNSLICQ